MDAAILSTQLFDARSRLVEWMTGFISSTKIVIGQTKDWVNPEGVLFAHREHRKRIYKECGQVQGYLLIEDIGESGILEQRTVAGVSARDHHDVLNQVIKRRLEGANRHMEELVEGQREELREWYSIRRDAVEVHEADLEVTLTMCQATLNQWTGLSQVKKMEQMQKAERPTIDPVCLVIMPPEVVQRLSLANRAEVEECRRFIEKGARIYQDQLNPTQQRTNSTEEGDAAFGWSLSGCSNLLALYEDETVGPRLRRVRTLLYELANKRNVHPVMYEDIMETLVGVLKQVEDGPDLL